MAKRCQERYPEHLGYSIFLYYYSLLKWLYTYFYFSSGFFPKTCSLKIYRWKEYLALEAVDCHFFYISRAGATDIQTDFEAL